MSYAAKATGDILSGQYDGGLTTFYEVLPDASPIHIQHNGINRIGGR
jgi:hypothetical protein